MVTGSIKIVGVVAVLLIAVSVVLMNKNRNK